MGDGRGDIVKFIGYMPLNGYGLFVALLYEQGRYAVVTRKFFEEHCEEIARRTYEQTFGGLLSFW